MTGLSVLKLNYRTEMSDISVSEIQLSYPRGKHIKKILNLLKKGKNRVMGEKAELDIS